jgi:hypothetical protein
MKKESLFDHFLVGIEENKIQFNLKIHDIISNMSLEG